MKRFSIRKTVVAGAIAALALGSGMLPNALTAGSTPTAQASELAQRFDRYPGPHSPLAGPSSFHGRRHFVQPGFSSVNWGWGYHRQYPQYYTSYMYEPVNSCSAYYFDEYDGVWYCYNGY